MPGIPFEFRTEAIPVRQFLDGVAKQAVFAILVIAQRRRIFDRMRKVMFEMCERKPGRTYEAARERLLDERLELDEPKQGNGALPAVPDETFILRYKLRVTGAKKPGSLGAPRLIVECHHRESFTHARSDEFVGLGVKNDSVKRIRIAIKDRGHDAVCGRG